MFSYQRNFTLPTEAVTSEVFWGLLRDPKTIANIEGYRQTGNAQLKRRLPAFMFQATFDETESKSGKMGRWRKQAATRLTGLVVMDVDHLENPLQIFQGEELRMKTEELGIVLVYITPSGKGLKIVFKARPEWGNLIDNQHRMAELLGLEVDESCKDASRMSFVCREEDILFINEKELFSYENREFAERYEEAYRQGQSKATRTLSPEPGLRRKLPNADARLALPLKGEGETSPQDTSSLPLREGPREGLPLYHGVEYSKIIEAWLEGKTVEPGDRHRTSLILADHLRYITDNDAGLIEQILRETPFVKEIVDERNEDVAMTVKSAQEFKMYKNIPNRMREALDKAGATANGGEDLKDVVETPLREMNSQLDEWGGQLERLFGEFPALRDICKGLKRSQYPAAVFVGGGLLMTLMTRCTYRFYHRPEELRRLNNSTLIIGDPASGKSFATRLYKLLSTPIVEADKVGKEAINAYRELVKTKGANKDRPKKPKVIVRIHPARTSNAQFIQDMVNAVEEVDGRPMQLHMLTFDTELDNTVTVQRGGSWIDKQSMELKAFHNEEDGQAYSNVDSVMQDFEVTWNFIYTGTPIALKRKVNEQNFGSGLATRLTCIPLPATNFEMMERETSIDLESDKRLEMWARRLDRMKGLLPLEKIVDELYDWTARRMMDALENESKAEEMLLKRCAYHGLNFSAPFIVMRHWGELHQDGDMWCGTFETDDTDWQLAELLTNIQYACQRHYFGAMAETYFDNKMKSAYANVQHRQKTVECFNRLPEEFTNEDVMRCFNLGSVDSARKKTFRLWRDHLVEKIKEEKRGEKALFRKTGIMLP